MAEIKVEDYLNGSVVISDTDIFDLTVDLSGGNFESRRLPFAILKLITLGVRRFKVTRDFNDFAIAALTNQLEIFVLPAGFALATETTRHDTSWLGGGASLVESTVGILGELDRYSPGGAFDIFQAVADKLFDHNSLNFLEDWINTTSIRGSITADVDLNLLTQGDIEYIFYVEQIK